MEIGQFRERITIQTATNATNENTGEIDKTWVDGDVIWAMKDVLTGKEGEKSDIVTTTDRTAFFIRYGHNIDNPTNYRIKYNSKVYDIEAIEEVDFKRIERLRCVQRSNITT